MVNTNVTLMPPRRIMPLMHPEISSLAATFPHHKHLASNLREHRVTAPGIQFDAPNLDTVLQDVRREWLR